MRTDSELIEASRRGEQAAFGELVSRYQDIVGAVSYSSTGDRSISEDVAQDTFVAAWQTLDRLRTTTSFGPWLCGIARNLGRKARKRSRPDKRVGLTGDVAGGSTPYDDAAQADVESVVGRALARVPIACREVLVLYYREDQSIRDVAVALGISEEAVMQRLSRGRRYLAAEVTDIVERSLAGRRPRRDLVAAVLASIAAIALPSRVDASPSKGSTMLKISLAASALIASGTAVSVLRRHHTNERPRPAAPALHYGRKDAHPKLSAPRTLLAPAERVRITDDLSLLPDDAEIVFGIDAAQLRSSAIWQRFVAPRLAQASAVDHVKTACGFDPMASIDSVAVGLRGVNGDAVAGTIVVHGLDKDSTLACLAKHPVDDLTLDGDVVMLAHDGQRVGFTFIDNRTLVLVVGDGASTKESVRQVAAGGGHLASSPGFADLFQNIHSEDTMWLVLAPSVPLFSGVHEAFAKQNGGGKLDLAAVYGSIDVSDSLTLEARLRLGSDAQAAFWVSEIQKSLAEPAAAFAINQFFDAIDVTADADDVRIDAASTADQLALVSAAIPVTETSDDDDTPGAPGVKIDVSVSTK